MLTPFRSAQSHNGKIASLSQEVFRIMSNCNEFVSVAERTELLEDLSERLKMSGYPAKVSGQVMMNGLKCYFMKVEKARKMGKMFHRPGSEGRVERKINKLAGKNTWFRPGSGKAEKNGVVELDNEGSTKGLYREGMTNGGGFGPSTKREPLPKNVAKRSEKDIVVAAPLFIQATGNGRL